MLYTLATNTNYSAIAALLNNGDAIDVAGYMLTIDVTTVVLENVIDSSGYHTGTYTGSVHGTSYANILKISSSDLWGVWFGVYDDQTGQTFMASSRSLPGRLGLI